MENSSRGRLSRFLEEAKPRSQRENSSKDELTAPGRHNENVQQQTQNALPPQRFENYTVEAARLTQNVNETAQSLQRLTVASHAVSATPLPPPPPPRQSSDSPQQPCSFCNKGISAEDPSFQCLECVEYFICQECYLRDMKRPGQDHWSPYDQDRCSHRFEGIPPLVLRGKRIPYRVFDETLEAWVDGRRMARWEPFVTPDGRVSELFFTTQEVFLDNWENYHWPDLKHNLSPHAWYTRKFYEPVRSREKEYYGIGAVPVQVINVLSPTLRNYYQSYGIEYQEVLNPQYGTAGASNERSFPHLTRSAYRKLVFTQLLMSPEHAYNGDLRYLKNLPQRYKKRLPPGLPLREYYFVAGQPPKTLYTDIDYASYKFPPGRSIS